jgi:hypothetical protein
VDRRHKLPSLPGHTGIVWKVQDIVMPHHERRDLLPDPPMETGPPDTAYSDGR